MLRIQVIQICIVLALLTHKMVPKLRYPDMWSAEYELWELSKRPGLYSQSHLQIRLLNFFLFTNL
jgi:hypothetical protein